MKPTLSEADECRVYVVAASEEVIRQYNEAASKGDNNKQDGDNDEG
jgi:hypothetical protein